MKEEVWLDPATGSAYFPGPLVVVADVDPTARRRLQDYVDRYGGPLKLGHSKVAHRDLGYCSNCVPFDPDEPWYSAACELAGWRILAMAKRGTPDETAVA